MFHLYTSNNHRVTNALLNTDHIREQQQQAAHLSLSDQKLITILLLFLFLIMISSVQILMVHTAPLRRTDPSVKEKVQIQRELKQMDKTMEKLSSDNVLPIDKWRLSFNIQKYVYRFQDLFYLVNKENYTIYNSSDNETQRNYCDEQPSQLQGRFLNETSPFANVSLSEIEENYIDVKSGGQWSPSHCLAQHKVAIIIPYRDRFEHLVTLLYYLHPILQRQELDYKIYVSEQIGNGTYNKGVLMNAAFIYALKEDDYQCFVFHDVDLIPADDRNMYSCPMYPRHMSVAIDEMNYRLRYEELIGGVLNIPREHFLTVNGYSNLYWGWGAEDDDLYYRFQAASIRVLRPPSYIARYKMLLHTKRTPSIFNKRKKLLTSAAKRYTWDGVSSARYNLLSVTPHPLFTHMIIDVGDPPPGFN